MDEKPPTEPLADPILALEEAIEICGGTVAAFALAISTEKLPVKANLVSMWKARESVPSNYIPAIYRETFRRGKPIAPERLDSSVDWQALRQQVSAAEIAEPVATVR